MLTQVNYRTGRMHDMRRITELTHARGAIMLWDLAHSAGAVPIDVTGANVDFAVGCGYKYLNGGPGAPAFLYVAKRHQSSFDPVLSGWHGHATPVHLRAVVSRGRGNRAHGGRSARHSEPHRARGRAST